MKKYIENLPNIMENLGPHSINSKQVKNKDSARHGGFTFNPRQRQADLWLEASMVYTASFRPARVAY